MTDQLRGDCLGYAGHPDVKTPYLDTLAAEGQYFDNAYTSCPSCIAARTSLMTGLFPEHNGRVGYKDGVDWTYPTTLAGELAKVGFLYDAEGYASILKRLQESAQTEKPLTALRR